MIKGTYIYYEDGQEIYRSENVITKYGKRFLTNFISGRDSFASKSMAFGIDSTAAQDTNTRLGFEFYRTPVLFGSTDIQTLNDTTTYAVVYKATIPQDVAGYITEVGLYPEFKESLTSYDSKFIADFDNQLDWTNTPLITTTDARVGQYLLSMSSNGTSAKEYKSNIQAIDLSGYSVNDTLKLAYVKNDANLQNIIIKFYSSASDYYSVTVTPASGTGYKLSSDITIDNLFSNASTANVDPSNINQIGIVITPSTGQSTSVGLDALRINDEDTFDPNFGLISRSVLSTPLVKLAGRQVDVEYRLDLGF
jgi:archaellin